MTQNLILHVGRFAADESGTLAVHRLFMVAAALAVGLVVIGVVSFGVGAAPESGPSPQAVAEEAFRAANYGRDRGTALADGPRAYYSATQMRERYDLFSDPAETSNEQVRSAHRTWTRRVDDPAYSQPGRAADMVRILEQALAARGLEPHRNF